MFDIIVLMIFLTIYYYYYILFRFYVEDSTYLEMRPFNSL